MGQPAWPGELGRGRREQTGWCIIACHQLPSEPDNAPPPPPPSPPPPLAAPLQLVGLGIEDPACAAVHAPLALLPVPYPRATFEQAKQAALAFNAMIDAVAQDEAYLQEVLAAAAQEDEFTVRRLLGRLAGAAPAQAGARGAPSSSRGCSAGAHMCPQAPPTPAQARLLQVFRETAEARHARQAAGRERVLGVLRSDYMLHAPTSSLLQVGVGRGAGGLMGRPCRSCRCPGWCCTGLRHPLCLRRHPACAACTPIRLPLPPALPARRWS